MANPYFNAEYYLSQNPDLFAAGINSAEGAWEHYVNFGAAEALNGATSRKPAPWFDVSYYLTTYPDLNTSGLTAGQLFDHFTTFGIDEDRQPSADAVITEAGLLAYAKANEDLMEAFGIEEDAEELTDEQADALTHHFYAFGYQEERDGAPFTIDDSGTGQTFTLTTGVDNWTGTAKNEVVQGILGDGATLNTFDSIDGAGGTDTLNLLVGTGATLPSNISIKNIDVVNLLSDKGATLGTVNAAAFGAAAKQIWQVGAAGSTVSGIAADQTVGFRDIATTTTQNVTLQFTGSAANIALDGDGALQFVIEDVDTGANDVDLETLNVSGSTDGLLEFGTTLPDTLVTINLALDTDSDISVQDADALSAVVTIDASESTGDLTVGYANVADSDLESLTLGSGDDDVSIDVGNFTADAVAVDLGAGSDEIEVVLSESESAVTIAGGAGDDTFVLSGGNVSLDADGELESSVTITDFGNGDDLLKVVGFDGFTAQTAVNNAIKGAESLEEALGLLEELLGAGGTNITDFAQFVFEGNTYLYGNIETGDSLEGDFLVGFTGVVDLNNDNVVQAV